MSTPATPAGRIPLTAILLLTLAPMMWAGNAVVGRLLADLIPPVTLNLVRWSLALLVFLPFSWRTIAPSSPLWAHWKRYAIVGLLGIGCYNMFQYMALHTSTPVNVTLVAASMPLWMMIIGRLIYKVPITLPKLFGAGLSLAGVLFVLSRGSLANLLQLQLVVGDLYMLAATACWSMYSWMLLYTREPVEIRSDWKGMLMAQLCFGVLWSIFFTGLEWAVMPDLHVDWQNPTLIIGLAFVVLGPALLAYACWGIGIQHVGPTIGGFFTNLTPLFAAVMSVLLLGDMPAWYHGVAFLLIVGGIVVSSRR